MLRLIIVPLKELKNSIFGNNHNEGKFYSGRKSRLKSGNRSVQNLLSSSLLSKNINFKIYRTVILPVVLYGCDIRLLTLRAKRRR